MTWKRYLSVGAIFGMMCLLGFAVAWGIEQNRLRGPGVTKANFDRIEKGMTKRSVEAILGKGFPAPGTGYPLLSSYYWVADDGSGGDILFVYMAGQSEDVVHSKLWHDSHETFIETAIRVIGLRKKATTQQ